MIVPVYLNLFHKTPTQINENIILVNEQGAVSAYNILMQKVGKLSLKSISNKIYQKNFGNIAVNGRVWAIFSNKILVEIEYK